MDGNFLSDDIKKLEGKVITAMKTYGYERDVLELLFSDGSVLTIASAHDGNDGTELDITFREVKI